MTAENKQNNQAEISVSLKELKREPYHKLSIAFALMTVIPFLVFFYIIATRLFSINIVIGDVGLALAITLYLSFLGYLLGFSIVRNLLSRIIGYTEKIRLAYVQLRETQDLLVQSEKFKAIGELSSGIAHEVKNPLGIILQDVNYLEDNSPSKEELAHIVNMMKKNIARADSIINTLVDFSKTSQLNIEPLDINSIIDNSLLLIKHRSSLENITVIREFKGDLPKILADTIRIEQVFVNIFLNAVQAMAGGGKLFVRTYQKKIEEIKFHVTPEKGEDPFGAHETLVVVEIEDTGAGIPRENLKRIFDPFFTTKRPKEGTGLGLFVTRNIIELHRGLINIESEEEKGAKVTIILRALGG